MGAAASLCRAGPPGQAAVLTGAGSLPVPAEQGTLEDASGRRRRALTFNSRPGTLGLLKRIQEFLTFKIREFPVI